MALFGDLAAYDGYSDEHICNVISKYQLFAKTDPLGYCQRILGIRLWKRQVEVMHACADPTIAKISVRSGNAVGKTYLAASIIAQYLDTHAPGYAVVTGASWQGVLKTVWPTFKRIHRAAPVDLGGEVLGTEWRRGDMWGAFCVSPDAPENISGFRTENGALVLVDEASSLQPEVYEAIQGLCSARGSKIVLLGNPLRPEGPFYTSFHAQGWANFHISSIEAAEQNIPGLASPEWIESQRLEWGEDSPMWKARIMGEFPEDADTVLIPLSAVEARTIPTPISLKGWIRLGVDVGRFGDDPTVIIARDDRSVQELRQYHGRDTMETVGWIRKAMTDFNARPENTIVDDTGLGGGVVDRLHELDIPVVGVNFGSKAYEEEKFANRRAEMHWNLRSALVKESENPLFIPSKYNNLLKQLPWARYKMNSRQQIVLEPKEDIKKRHGHSNDYADALALTYDVYGNYDFA
jgi:hypothetical protein